MGVHDTLRGLYFEVRRVNVGFFLEEAIDHRPTHLRSGLGLNAHCV